MEDNTIKELTEYYSSLPKEDIIEKIIEILFTTNIYNMTRENIIEIIISSTTKDFKTSKIKFYIEKNICKEKDSIGDCATKFYIHHNNNIIKKLDGKSIHELREMMSVRMYKYYSMFDKKFLVSDIVKLINNQKVNNQQLKILGGINSQIISIPKENVQIIKEDEDLLVLRYGDSIIKFESEHNDDYKYHFNSIINEMFVSSVATNSYEGFVTIEIGNIGSKCPDNIENTLCSIIKEDFLNGNTLHNWITYNIGPSFGIKLSNILLKVFTNLYHIHKDTGFTHYDLHTGNVIVDEDDTPHIIDYGLSYIKYDGKNYGTILPIGEVYNRPMWLHDIFKLLMNVFGRVNVIILENNIDQIINFVLYCTKNFNEVSKNLNESNRAKLRNMYAYSKGFDLPRRIKITITNEKFNTYFNHFEEQFEYVHIFFLLSKALNIILNQHDMFLVSKSFKNKPDNYFTFEEYKENINSYVAPSKMMQDNNNMTFKNFLTNFELQVKNYDTKLKYI